MHFTYVDFVADYPTLINLDIVFVGIKPLHYYEEGGTLALMITPHKIATRKEYISYVLHSCH